MAGHRKHSQKYVSYINSAAWRARRAARLALSGVRCEWTVQFASGEVMRCPRTYLLGVHHKTYVRLGEERDDDLAVYCWFHHTLEHLMWKKCSVCKAPALGNDLEAARWLDIVLAASGIRIDDTPRPSYRDLPLKEHFSVQIPPVCENCDYTRR